jgi:uncharacterized protein
MPVAGSSSAAFPVLGDTGKKPGSAIIWLRRRTVAPTYISGEGATQRVSNFIVPVAEILGRPGHYRDFEIAQPVPGARTTLARADQGPTSARLRAESVVEGILVTGRVTGRAMSECARCLSEVRLELDLEVCDLFVAPGHEPDDATDDAYEVIGTDIDLEPMLRDAVTLSLPLNPVCRPECKGLCSHCGSDLNRGECGCVLEERDPRWTALDDLRLRLERDSTGAADEHRARTQTF